MNKEDVKSNQFFPVNVSHQVPNLKIGFFPDFQTFMFASRFLDTYFTTLDKKSQDLMRLYSPTSVLTISTQGNSFVINGFSNYNRNHSENISQNEYVSRIIMGNGRIYEFFKDKYKNITHEETKYGFDVTTFHPAPNVTLLNIVVFGQMTVPKDTIDFHMTLIVMPGAQQNPPMIMNQSIQLQVKKANFTMAPPTADARSTLTRLAIEAQQTGLDMNQLGFPIAKMCGFDYNSTSEKLKVIGVLCRNGASINDAYRIYRLYSFNEKMMQQDLITRFQGNIPIFIQKCIDICTQKGI